MRSLSPKTRARKKEWNANMPDELFAACANLAGAVGQCEGFLSGIQTSYPALPRHVRHAAGEFGRELSEKWDCLRVVIENMADQMLSEEAHS